MKTRTTLLAAAMTAAMVTSAQADTILFDPDGANFNGGANKAPILVDTFDWDFGNAVLVNGVNANAVDVASFGGGPTGDAYVVAQSRLSAFQFGGPTAPSTDNNNDTIDDADGGSFYEFTFQFRIPVIVTPEAVGAGDNVFVGIEVDPDRASSFQIFADAVADGEATGGDNTGCGYGTFNAGACGADGSISILSGTINTNSTISFQSLIYDANAPTPVDLSALDQHDGADGLGVDSVAASGTFNLRVDVTNVNSDFFLTDVTQLSFDSTTAGGGPAPFTETNPTEHVAGEAPVDYGSDGINDYSCGTNQAEFCDLHVSADLATSFNHDQPVPVGGPLPLLAAGLGLLGLAGRLRRSRG